MNTDSRDALFAIRRLVEVSDDEARGEEMTREELRHFVEAVSSQLRIIEEEAFGPTAACEEGHD